MSSVKPARPADPHGRTRARKRDHLPPQPGWPDENGELIQQAREMVDRNWRFLADLQRWMEARPGQFVKTR